LFYDPSLVLRLLKVSAEESHFQLQSTLYSQYLRSLVLFTKASDQFEPHLEEILKDKKLQEIFHLLEIFLQILLAKLTDLKDCGSIYKKILYLYKKRSELSFEKMKFEEIVSTLLSISDLSGMKKIELKKVFSRTF